MSSGRTIRDRFQRAWIMRLHWIVGTVQAITDRRISNPTLQASLTRLISLPHTKRLVELLVLIDILERTVRPGLRVIPPSGERCAGTAS